ncbi:conjugation TrbI family protein [Burkholderiales bacterium GJ-E10]|nr:conjugation TrbI family protein [Burkholderiales bacterium GJ-E10]
MSEETDRDLLEADVDGSTASREPLRIRGTPSKGPRLSKNLKGALAVLGGLAGVGIVIGVMSAGQHAKTKPESADAARVGQTKPDVDAMEQAADKARLEQDAAGGDSSTPRVSARTDKAAAPAALQAGPASAAQLTPEQKYRQWLDEQRYKNLEGAILAAQSARLAKTVPEGAVPQGAQRPDPPGAAVAPSGDLGTTLQNALAGLQPPHGAAGAEPQGQQGAQQQNKAFLAAQSKSDGDYLPASVQPPRARHELFAGSVIPAVLVTGINSDLPGSISAQVRETVYDSLDPDVVLIPQGTRLIGQYSSDVAYGQRRVLVAWNQVIFPNGSTIDLKGMEGTDGQGQAGFRDRVDNHYMRIFGSAILMSLLSAGAQLSQPQNANMFTAPSAGQEAAAALGQELNMVGQNLLNRNLNIQPTLVIRPGYAFNVLVSRTMILSPYPAQ